jgi:hypothetical protein
MNQRDFDGRLKMYRKEESGNFATTLKLPDKERHRVAGQSDQDHHHGPAEARRFGATLGTLHIKHLRECFSTFRSRREGLFEACATALRWYEVVSLDWGTAFSSGNDEIMHVRVVGGDSIPCARRPRAGVGAPYCASGFLTRSGPSSAMPSRLRKTETRHFPRTPFNWPIVMHAQL